MVLRATMCIYSDDVKVGSCSRLIITSRSSLGISGSCGPPPLSQDPGPPQLTNLLRFNFNIIFVFYFFNIISPVSGETGPPSCNEFKHSMCTFFLLHNKIFALILFCEARSIFVLNYHHQCLNGGFKPVKLVNSYHNRTAKRRFKPKISYATRSKKTLISY